MTFDREPFEPLTIDMTPLVDCIFAIILFLLVASSFIEGIEQDVSINLPTMSKVAPSKPPPSPPVVVNVRFTGAAPAYVIESQQRSIPDIRNYLSKKRMAFKDQSVVIRGDKACRWDDVAAVLKCCADAGISKISADYQVIDTR